MYSLDPDFLRTFLAIADAGGFGAAAERVNKTQSTVSAQVKRLEEILGVKLFEKVGRKNILTCHGEKLMEYARSMVRLNDETVSTFRNPEISGAIRIATSDDYARAFLPRALSSFARSHAAVDLEVVTDTTADLWPNFDQQGFDMVILSARAGEVPMEILRRDKLHWIGPDNSNLAMRDPLPLALWPEGCSWRDAAIASLAKIGKPWRLAYTTSNVDLLTATVAEQLGLTVGPSWYLRPGLRIIEELDEECPLGTTEIGMAMRRGDTTPPLEAFADHLRRQFSSVLAAAA